MRIAARLINPRGGTDQFNKRRENEFGKIPTRRSVFTVDLVSNPPQPRWLSKRCEFLLRNGNNQLVDRICRGRLGTAVRRPVDNSLNSGVQIRSSTKPAGSDNPERVNGLQVETEVTGVNGSFFGYVYGEATGGGGSTPDKVWKAHRAFKNGAWSEYRVIAQGPRFQTFINGKPVDDLTDEAILETHSRGFIDLQVHGIVKGTGPYVVAWRGLRICELP